MQLGESKKIRDWKATVAKGCLDYHKKNNSLPDTISVNSEFYMELCAAAGSLIKTVSGMRIIVRWGGNGA